MQDRAYSYDSAGRLQEAYTGSEARNYVDDTSGGTPDGPHRHSFSYDAWDNLTAVDGRLWSRDADTFAAVDTNNRNPNWSYDAEGNVLSRNEDPDPNVYLFTPARNTFDAAGFQVSTTQSRTYNLPEEGGLVANVYSNTQTFDGDGQAISYTSSRAVSLNGFPTGGPSETGYWLRSTVLGGKVISEYDVTGWKLSQVYAGGERIGQQTKDGSGQAYSLWFTTDPVTGDHNPVNGSWLVSQGHSSYRITTRQDVVGAKGLCDTEKECAR
jgi:hypothetical protein